MDEKANVIDQFPPFIREHPLSDKLNTFTTLLDNASNLPSDFPNMLVSNHAEWYMVIKLTQSPNSTTSLILGPCLTEKFTSNAFYRIISTARVPMKWKDSLRDYFTSLPVKSQQKLADIAQLVYFLLYRKQISLDDFYLNNSAFLQLETKTDMDLFLSEQRLNENFHHDTSFEKTLISFVKKGQTEEVTKFFREKPPLTGTGILAKDNQIRINKNLAITLVTLAGRAAIDAGLHYEVAYSLSDKFVQKIEEIVDFDDWYSYSHEIFYEFASRVKQLQQDNYSKSIVQVQQYIFNRLYEKLTLSDIANHVELHPNYLSRIFKDETGKSITEFILEEKIKEACLWLSNSDMAISDIASQLNFSDQSYFIKMFKRLRQVTPKQYRMRQKLFV